MLVHEAHHRIKNNLQLVATMLHLQARQHADVRVLQEALVQASQRVQAVAQVHDRLHRGSGSDLDAGAYMRDLCTDLSRSLGLPGCDAVVVEAPKLLLQADRTLRLGLIVTELVTNAVKHGIGQSGRCEVRVVLGPANDDTLYLLVADSGPGIPESALRQSATDGLGMHLVRHLTRTIGGRLDIDGTPPGSRCTVRFAMHPPPEGERNAAGSRNACA